MKLAVNWLSLKAHTSHAVFVAFGADVTTETTLSSPEMPPLSSLYPPEIATFPAGH
ncbi:hypothetical protein [Nonomuraea maritima]|uniref:hypothetical protein n=1 Tax=Nonomuraea maritima TaxID=683260 RepID=UPI001C40AD7D|nr:hypothetical protein [Nonomuraea maritima]